MSLCFFWPSRHNFVDIKLNLDFLSAGHLANIINKFEKPSLKAKNSPIKPCHKIHEFEPFLSCLKNP